MTTFDSVEALLAHARAGMRRLTVTEARDAVAAGALLVDIRPQWQRVADGEIPGSLVVERNHLEWRLHPASDARLPQAVAGQRWVVVCTEGYTSSLAAASLSSIGVEATDVVGGLHAWRAAGLPVVPGGTPVEHLVHDPTRGAA
jgi:rhodanese-related sulfurtransferase